MPAATVHDRAILRQQPESCEGIGALAKVAALTSSLEPIP
jgi:hypothetical protein